METHVGLAQQRSGLDTLMARWAGVENDWVPKMMLLPLTSLLKEDDVIIAS